MTRTPDGLPPLREVIARHGLRAQKALGQNFLLDLNLTRRIARGAGPLEGHAVIEVGPGPGGLTRSLLLEGAEKVIAIERDERAVPALEEIAARWPGRLEIVHADALEVDFPALADRAGLPVKVVANLPYNIATPLLTGWLTDTALKRCHPPSHTPAQPSDNCGQVVGGGRGAVAASAQEDWPPWWMSLTLMFQKEVAERISAAPKTKAYGRLAVLAQWRAWPRVLFEVPARAFTPPPKVTSAIVRIVPEERPADPRDVAALEKVTQAAFGQRRKMLRQSLKALLPDPRPLMERANIPPTRRAEELSVADFVRLAAVWEKMQKKRE